MRKMNTVIMTLAGLLLMVAAVLKVHELMTVAIPSWDVKAALVIDKAAEAGDAMPAWKANLLGFWESYEFLLMQIPLEFALGAWMVSGLFRKAAWIAGTLAYFGFIFATLSKVITGAESCGCFGQVHVDPWITLLAIDMPFFLLLLIFRPKGEKLLPPPWPNVAHAIVCAVPILAVLALTVPAIVTFRPEFKKAVQQTDVSPEAKIKLLEFQHKQEKAQWQQEAAVLAQQNETMANQIAALQAEIAQLKAAIDTATQAQTQVVPEPTPVEPAEAETVEAVETQQTQQAAETQIEPDEPQPAPVENAWEWLGFVVEDDVRDELSTGMAVVLMYHHDCPTCAEVVPAYSAYYKDMVEQGNDAFKIAFLAVPPYAETGPVPDDTTCITGTLTDEQKWEVMSPYVVVLLDGELIKTWKQGTAPEAENILDEVFGQ